MNFVKLQHTAALLSLLFAGVSGAGAQASDETAVKRRAAEQHRDDDFEDFHPFSYRDFRFVRRR